MALPRTVSSGNHIQAKGIPQIQPNPTTDPCAASLELGTPMTAEKRKRGRDKGWGAKERKKKNNEPKTTEQNERGNGKEIARKQSVLFEDCFVHLFCEPDVSLLGLHLIPLHSYPPAKTLPLSSSRVVSSKDLDYFPPQFDVCRSQSGSICSRERAVIACPLDS